MGATLSQIDETRRLVRELACAYADVRRDNVVRGESEQQTDALAILIGDLGAFCFAGVELLSAGHWGPANALSRLTVERAEYVLAVHEDAEFAAAFWDRSARLPEEADRAPRNRTGEARTIARRVAERRAGTEVADRFLASLIAKHDWDSVAVHPNAVAAALGLKAGDDQSGEDALAIALGVLTAVAIALAFLVLVVEERGPEGADLLPARALLQRAGRRFRT